MACLSNLVVIVETQLKHNHSLYTVVSFWIITMIGSKLRFYFAFEILPCRSHKQKAVWPCRRTKVVIELAEYGIKGLAVTENKSFRPIKEDREKKLYSNYRIYRS